MKPVSDSAYEATTLAEICAPIAPPTVRAIVLTPVATPVCVWGTASTIRLAIAANEKLMPAPISDVETRISQTWSCATASMR